MAVDTADLIDYLWACSQMGRRPWPQSAQAIAAAKGVSEDEMTEALARLEQLHPPRVIRRPNAIDTIDGKRDGWEVALETCWRCEGKATEEDEKPCVTCQGSTLLPAGSARREQTRAAGAALQEGADRCAHGQPNDRSCLPCGRGDQSVLTELIEALHAGVIPDEELAGLYRRRAAEVGIMLEPEHLMMLMGADHERACELVEAAEVVA